MKTKSLAHSLRKKLPLLLLFLLTCSPLITLAQDNMYVIVEYMKTKPGKEWNYVELERNFWKPVHSERVKNGEIVAWLLYHIRYTATNDPYNYATVTIFADPEKLENPGTVDPVTVHPDKDVEKVLIETEESRDLVIRNLMMRKDYIEPFTATPDPKFVEVDYMKVEQGDDDEYLRIEDEVWKPIHEEFIKEGSRVGWSLWGRMFPSGYGMDYQYLTVNDFNDFSQIGQANYAAAIQAVHPNKNISDIIQETYNSRKLVKSELWELLDATY